LKTQTTSEKKWNILKRTVRERARNRSGNLDTFKWFNTQVNVLLRWNYSQCTFQMCGPFVMNFNVNFQISRLGCNHIIHPVDPRPLNSCQSKKHLGFALLLSNTKLISGNTNVDIDFILNARVSSFLSIL
jgi:hypothetical protein